MLIYSHYNPITKMRYIGQTKFSIESRLLGHVKAAIRGSTYDFHIALMTYPLNEWVSEILEDGITDIDLLNEREIFWIEHYDSYNNGYNHTKGGVHGWDHVNENRKGEHHPMLGKTHTEEAKAKIRKARSEQAPLSIESRKRISEAHKGIPRSDETKAKIGGSLKGKPSKLKGRSRPPELMKRIVETRMKNKNLTS